MPDKGFIGQVSRAQTASLSEAQIQTLIDASRRPTVLSLGNVTGGANVLAGGATSYLTFVFTGASNVAQGPNFSAGGVESQRQMKMSRSGTLRDFIVATATTQPNDGDLVLTVRVNGVDTAITITIPADAVAGTFSDLTHSAVVAQGDLVSFSGVNGSPGSSSAGLWHWAISYE